MPRRLQPDPDSKESGRFAFSQTHRIANLLRFYAAYLALKLRACARLRTWRFARSLSPGHAAYPLRLDDLVAPCLEYFLSLRHVAGFENKVRELREVPVGPDSSNVRNLKWASRCAELGATMIVGSRLRLRIVGFDGTSPNATRPNSNCDLVFEHESSKYFVEVKRKASTDAQQAPRRLVEALRGLKLPFGIVIQMRDRKYNCDDLPKKLQAIQGHVAAHQASEASNASAPHDLQLRQFSIHFFKKYGGSVDEYFQPDYLRDIRSHLLGDGRSVGDPARKVPMVEAARSKGADFLACRVSDLDGIDRVVEHCFPSIRYRSEVHANAEEPDLGGLSGILLFSRYDCFRLITQDRPELNALTGTRRWKTGR